MLADFSVVCFRARETTSGPEQRLQRHRLYVRFRDANRTSQAEDSRPIESENAHRATKMCWYIFSLCLRRKVTIISTWRSYNIDPQPFPHIFR